MTYAVPPPWQRGAPTGPHLAWLWLGVALAVLALGTVIAYGVTHIRELDAASVEPESGPGQVTIELSASHDYGVYVPVEVRETGTGLTCSASAAGVDAPLVLSEWDGGIDGVQREEFGRSWEAVGAFSSPVSGHATVLCPAASAGLLVRPDDDIFAVFGVLVIGGGLVGLGGVALAIVIGVLGGQRSRAARGAPGGPYAAYPPNASFPSYPPSQGFPPMGHPHAPPPVGPYPPRPEPALQDGDPWQPRPGAG